jgi:hypothetical protein
MMCARRIENAQRKEMKVFVSGFKNMIVELGFHHGGEMFLEASVGTVGKECDEVVAASKLHLWSGRWEVGRWKLRCVEGEGCGG